MGGRGSAFIFSGIGTDIKEPWGPFVGTMEFPLLTRIAKWKRSIVGHNDNADSAETKRQKRAGGRMCLLDTVSECFVEKAA